MKKGGESVSILIYRYSGLSMEYNGECHCSYLSVHISFTHVNNKANGLQKQ